MTVRSEKTRVTLFPDEVSQILFRTSREPMMVCSRDATILAVNLAACAMLGTDEHTKAIGQELFSIVDMDSSEWFNTIDSIFSSAELVQQLNITKVMGDQLKAEVRFVDLGDLGVLLGFQVETLATESNPTPQGFALEDIDSRLVIRANQYMQMYQDKERLANTDSLTGAENRRSFDASLKDALTSSFSEGSDMSLLMIDADHFKDLNDTLGHQTGDLVLQSLVSVIKGSVRSVDIVGRIGGEEFGVILPGTNRTIAVEIAERIRAGVESAEICPKTVTVSIGVATVSSALVDPKSILAVADLALYCSKSRGRNRVTHADELPGSKEATA